MVWWLRPLAALAKNLGSVLESTWWLTTIVTPVSGHQTPSLGFLRYLRHACGTQMYTLVKYLYTFFFKS